MNTKEATKVIQATQAVTKNKREENATSSLDAFVTVIKGNIGIGILALPLAFNKAGYLVAAVLLILMGIITTHCMWLLVTSAQTLSKRLGVEALEYGQVSELAFLSLHCEQINLGLCHISTTSLGKLCKLVVNFFLMLTQFGLSIVYFAFIAGSLQFVVSNTPYIKYDISVRIWIVIILVPFVLITYIRDLRTLSPFVAVANGCLFFVLSVIIVDAVYRFTTKQAAVNCEQQNFNITVDPSLAMICGVNPWPLSLNDLFVFFGMAVFTFEGIGFILPVENKMAKPQHFKPVLIVGMSVITVTYFSVGLLGYLSYGVCASANVTFDLRSNNVWLKSLYLIAPMYMAFAVYMTHPLQFYVPMDIIEPPLLLRMGLLETEGSKRRGMLKFLVQISIRTPIVVILCGISVISPNQLGDYISLVGAMAITALGYIFPAFLHIIVFAGNRTTQGVIEMSSVGKAEASNSDDKDGASSKSTKWQCVYKTLWVCKDAFILLFGVMGCVFGTYAALNELIMDFNKSPVSKECVGSLMATK